MRKARDGNRIRGRRCVGTAVVALLLLWLAPAAAAPPKGYDAERYRALWEKSPFAQESKEEAPQAAAPDMAMVGFARNADHTLVTIVDRRSMKRTLLASGESRDGMTLVELREADKPENVTAVIRVGGEEKTISFDSQLLMVGAQPAVAPRPGGSPTTGRVPVPALPLPAGTQIQVTSNVPPPPTSGMPQFPNPGMQAPASPGMMMRPPSGFPPGPPGFGAGGPSSTRRIRRPIIIPMRPQGTP